MSLFFVLHSIFFVLVRLFFVFFLALGGVFRVHVFMFLVFCLKSTLDSFNIWIIF